MESILQTISQATEVDAKIQALASLRDHLNAIDQLPEGSPDTITLSLKGLLRHPNSQLATQALSAIQVYIKLLGKFPENYNYLRFLLLSFLPSGNGLIDRLSDPREKIRDLARNILVELGCLSFLTRSEVQGGKEEDGPLTVWTTAIREVGFEGKNVKIKEQSLIVIGTVRARHTSFPLKPFMSSLVDLLEDGDGSVRDTARVTTITIFTAPTASPPAKAELKRMLGLKGVRKGIVDTILPKVFATSNPSAPVPSSSSIKAKDGMPSNVQGAQQVESSGQSSDNGFAQVETVYIASTHELENEFKDMLPAFEGKEHEHNWLLREKSMIRVRGMLKGDAFKRYPEAFIACLKGGWIEASLKALASLRTTVCTSTCFCYSSLATVMGQAFDPFVETILLPLSRMANFTKNLVVQQTQDTISVLLRTTSCPPRLIVPFISQAAVDKSPRARSWAFIHFKSYIDIYGVKSKHAIESSGGVNTLEGLVKLGLADSNSTVREPSRAAFWAFEAVWPAVGQAMLDKLDGMPKRQLLQANSQNKPGSTSSGSAAVAPVKAKVDMKSLIAAQRRAKLVQTQTPTPDILAGTSNKVSATSVPLPTSPPSRQDPLPQAFLETSVSRPSPSYLGSTSSATSSDLLRSRFSPTSTTLRSSTARQSSPSTSPISSRGQPLASTSTPLRKGPRFSSGQPTIGAGSGLLSSTSRKPPLVSKTSTSSSSENTLGTQANRMLLSMESQMDDFESMRPISRPLIPTNGYGVPPHLADSTLHKVASFETPVKTRRTATAPRESAGLSDPHHQHRAWEISSPKHLDLLKDKSEEFGDWRISSSAVLQDIPSETTSVADNLIADLQSNPPSLDVIRNLISLSRQHVLVKPTTRARSPSQSSQPSLGESELNDPSSSSVRFWEANKRFDKLFLAVEDYLKREKAEPTAEWGLVLLESLVDRQWTLFEAYENRLFDILLQLRIVSRSTIREATTILFSSIISELSPVYCLTMVATSLRKFLPPLDSPSETSPMRNTAAEDAKYSAGYCFGLLEIGRCFILLPGEIVQEELPRLMDLILPALYSKVLAVRESAATLILAAQLIVRDETLIFSLLNGITTDKINLLTYLFDKNHVRDGLKEDGWERVEREMKRLSLRTD